MVRKPVSKKYMQCGMNSSSACLSDSATYAMTPKVNFFVDTS